MKFVSTGYLFSCWIISRISKFIFIHWWAFFAMDSKLTFSEVIIVNCNLGPLCGPGPSASSRCLCLRTHWSRGLQPVPSLCRQFLWPSLLPSFLFPPSLIGSLISSFSKNSPILCPFLQWVLPSSCESSFPPVSESSFPPVSPPFLLWILLSSCPVSPPFLLWVSPPFLLCYGPSLMIFWSVAGTCALESWSPGLRTESPQCRDAQLVYILLSALLLLPSVQLTSCAEQGVCAERTTPPPGASSFAVLCGPRGIRRGGAQLSQWGGWFLNSEMGHPLASVPLGHREFD